MIRVLSIFGTRPEAIKMAPVVRAIERRAGFESVVCLTAQHRDMLDQVMRCFGITADHDLDLMTPSQSPADVASRVLSDLPPLLRSIRPDVLLVQGDTMTTLSAALAAFLERIPVGHVEAGLRTGDLGHPFPEEMNRTLTTRLASLHFPPTEKAREALLAEHVPDEDIVVTGNTVIDALLETVRPNHRFEDPVLAALDPDRRVILVTTHRRESFGAPLHDICGAVADLAKELPDCDFVLPVHRNPNVQRTVKGILSNEPNVHLIEPLEYLEFVQLIARAHLILTDSGGIQEEAPSLDKPVLVLREVTERPEGVAAGAARVVGTSRQRIVESALEIVRDGALYSRMARAENPYGDGAAAQRIIDALARRFGG